MNYNRLKQAHDDWLATNPDPAEDLDFLLWMQSDVTRRKQAALMTEPGLFDAIGPAMAESVMQKYEAVAQVDSTAARVVRWLTDLTETGKVDFARDSVRAQIDAMGPAPTGSGTFTEQEHAALMALGEETVPRSVAEYGIASVGQPHLDRLRLEGRIA